MITKIINGSLVRQKELKNKKQMKIYLNYKTIGGIETIDEFQIEENQSYISFRKYVNQMISEYSLAGISVYRSNRCTKDWRQK